MKSYQSFITQTFPKILCVGKNYIKHVNQMGGNQVPQTPVIFLKSWSSLNLNPKTLNLPRTKNFRVDHQVQLGVFINKSGKNIKSQNAKQHIGGYFLAIDITDRDFQQVAKQKGLPWTLSKSQDNFCPVSELFQQKNNKIDPYQIQLQILVNGKLRQKQMTKQMHFKIDQIIQYCSKYFTLNQGDLILTGTPDGVGPLEQGDKVQAYARRKEQVLAKLDFTIDKDN